MSHFPSMIIVATMQPFDCYLCYDMCSSHRFVLFGKISCCVSLGTPDKTERHKWKLVAEISHYPSSPRSRLPPRKKKNPYLLNSQTQPGNHIVIHRISPHLFLHTLLTQMEKKPNSTMMRLVPGNWLGVFVCVQYVSNVCVSAFLKWTLFCQAIVVGVLS